MQKCDLYIYIYKLCIINVNVHTLSYIYTCIYFSKPEVLDF